MTLTLKRRFGMVAWMVLVLICLIYAPMAIEYFGHYLSADAPRLWVHLFSWATSDAHVFGPGSVELKQRQVYAASASQMLIHTVGGGLVILLACLQFSAGFRQRYPDWHRLLGRVQVSIVVVAMVAAMIYLVRTGPADTYNGPAFFMQLWMLALGTLASTLLAVVAIVRGQVRMHYSLMAFSFVLLLSAPALRIEWLIFANLYPGMTQEMTNMASAIIFGFLSAPLAVAATRIMDSRPATTKPVGRSPGVRLQAMIWAVGVLVAVGLSVAYRELVGPFQWLHGVLLVTALGVFSAYGVTLIVALRGSHRTAMHEWRIHFAALGAAPVAMVLSWMLLGAFFTHEEAFWSAVLIGPAIALSIGFLIVTWSRRVGAIGRS
ncbi:MAG: DUF2306 domain-containing protein [Pseudomonadota bacterium]